MMAKKNVAVVDTSTGEIIGDADFKDNNNKQNKDFVMMYRQFINQIADLGMEDSIALKILLFIVRNMDSRNALGVPMQLLADILCISRQTASKKIKYLEDNGWIGIMKLGKSNIYIVNPNVVWTAYADDKQYCKFDAKVMLDPRDNWEFKSKDKITIRHIDKDILAKLAEENGIGDNQNAKECSDTDEISDVWKVAR